MTPYETAIFADTGQAKNLEFIEQEIKAFAKPYFSFSENFLVKNAMNLNNIYEYNRSIDSDFTEIFDANDDHGGVWGFYNVDTLGN